MDIIGDVEKAGGLWKLAKEFLHISAKTVGMLNFMLANKGELSHEV